MVHRADKIELNGEDSMRKLRSEIDAASGAPPREWRVQSAIPGPLPSDEVADFSGMGNIKYSSNLKE